MIPKKNPAVDISRMENMFLSLGLVISLSLVTILFNWKTYDKGGPVELVTVEKFEDVLDIPATVQPPPPPPAMQQPTIVSVSDEVEIEHELELNLDIEITEDMSIAPTVVENIIITEQMEEEVADEIFTIVEEQPSFQGKGNSEFLKWVGERLVYPPQAARMDIQGKVFIQFVIEKDGSVTDIVVLKGIGGGADEEAVKVVKSSPKWSPGKQRGRPVRVRMVLPITFILKT